VKVEITGAFPPRDLHRLGWSPWPIPGRGGFDHQTRGWSIRVNPHFPGSIRL